LRVAKEYGLTNIQGGDIEGGGVNDDDDDDEYRILADTN
jgi:hypothetical protein